MAKHRKPKGSRIKKRKSYNKQPEVQYLSRQQAIRFLQISPSEFQRLAILKGVYPQVPGGKRVDKQKTYYFKQDILSIMKHTLLDKMRKLKTYHKKKKRLESLQDTPRLLQLTANKPLVSLAPLILERYPTFQAALADLDDALSLICIFRQLPSTKVPGFDSSKATEIDSLFIAFLKLAIHRGAVQKVFVTLKGFYVQVDLDNTSIVWAMPHKALTVLPERIDYQVLCNFCELYSAQLNFVNFKLYSDSNLQYPPSDLSLSTCLEPQSIKPSSRLFDGCVFVLGEETPTEVLSLVITSGGGKVVEGSGGERVTHRVCDRDSGGERAKGGEEICSYETVQPQWVFDSLNESELQPVDRYAMDVECPEHISPFEQEKESE